ncbi:hypothetical protein FOZ60_005870 [Perkinsus olseni]|uniref:Uncharacterized protein n=1 Tax=Perkinsus olseni TaxID=32597 RepID=A0A7J6PFZ9_PEROL|nr:hypothetical protein FOZ60_005870 [Perkinsus olseni]KAF4728176.1 hypothetical protein FOZ62_002271 [Perkinsus olseni]
MPLVIFLKDCPRGFDSLLKRRITIFNKCLYFYTGSRFPSIQVRGIPYKYNATSGIIDADAESIRYNIFYRNVKSSDMHRIQYDESVDEVKLEIRYELIQRRKYRRFHRFFYLVGISVREYPRFRSHFTHVL